MPKKIAFTHFFAFATAITAFATVAFAPSISSALTLYTDRPLERMQPIADEFKSATGEPVTIVYGNYKSLLQKLKTERAASPADVIYVNDAVYLAELAAEGFLQPMNSPSIVTSVAAQMRDEKQLWTAITIRGRTIVYDPSRVNASELKGYADLADKKWSGRLCLRTSQSSYNEALVGGLIEAYGRTQASAIVAGWVRNLATAPAEGDTGVIEDIANGICDVGITNTYYLGQMLSRNPALGVKIHFADQDSGGVFGNGTGAGVSSSSKNVELATKFIELMLTEKFQKHLSAAHFDYPAKQGLAAPTLVKDWGSFKYNTINWSVIGRRAKEARDVMSEAKYE